MNMPGRTYSAGSSYRYGFNGKENDKDAGEGIQDYGMRISDNRVGRFFSEDPITKDYPELTPYQFASNTPIKAIDLDGLEAAVIILPKNISDQDKQDFFKGYNRGLTKGVKIQGVALLILADAYFLGGRGTMFYYSQKILGSLHHDKSKSPEQEAERRKEFKQNVTDAIVGFGVSKTIGVITKILSSSGKIVYKTFKSSSIRYSQSSVKGSDYEAVKKLISEGKDLGEIDIVKMKDNIYTSLDNKRLLAAKELGKDIEAVAHNYDDVLDAATQKRIYEAHGVNVKTWGEAIEARTAGQAKYISRDSPNGSFVAPKVSKN